MPLRLHLIAPTKQGETYLFNRGLLAPLGLMYLAAHTPPEVEVRLVDENVERIDFSDVPDLVGITTMTATAPRAYEIAGRYRSLGAKVVLGGVHASMLPDEAFTSEPFYTDWLDTDESQRLLSYQRRSFEDYVREMPSALGYRYLMVRAFRPFIRRYVLGLSPYYRSAGKHA